MHEMKPWTLIHPHKGLFECTRKFFVETNAFKTKPGITRNSGVIFGMHVQADDLYCTRGLRCSVTLHLAKEVKHG